MFDWIFLPEAWLALAWMMKLVAPWLIVLGQEISGRDLILILGGLFLLFKSTLEIHEALEGAWPPPCGVVYIRGQGVDAELGRNCKWAATWTSPPSPAAST